MGGGNGASRASTILQLAMKFADVATNNITIMQPNMAVLWALMALMVLLIGCYVVVTVTIALCQALLLIYAGIFVLGSAARVGPLKLPSATTKPSPPRA